MPDADGVKFPGDFVKRITSGELDPDLVGDLGRLTPEQRAELAQLLIDRQARRAQLN